MNTQLKLIQLILLLNCLSTLCSATSASSNPIFIDQKLNHSDPFDSQSFKQQYFFEASFAENNQAPVFFYLCGEEGCSLNHGIIQESAQKNKGYMIALEHRYFGRSSPFSEFTTKNLKYLTVDNAIEDAADFIRKIKIEKGLTGPWISMGGSYSGILSALLRQRHPELVVGALASSAPINAQDFIPNYDKSLAKTVGPDCAAKILKVTESVELALKSDQAREVKLRFGAEDLTDETDVLSWLADIAAGAVQYGKKDHFCSLLNTSDPMNAFSQYAIKLEKMVGWSALNNEVEGLLDPKAPLRAWPYLICTQLGGWQIANPDRKLSIRSEKLNADHAYRACRQLFGIEFNPHLDEWKKNIYLPILNPATTNILFTHGTEDPWLAFGISEVNENATNPNITTFLIHGVGHTSDFEWSNPSDSKELVQARLLFQKKIEEWTSSKASK